MCARFCVEFKDKKGNRIPICRKHIEEAMEAFHAFDLESEMEIEE